MTTSGCPISTTGEAAADDRVLTDADTVGIWCVHAGDAGATPVAVLARTTVSLPDGPLTVATHAAGDPRLAVRARDAVAEHLATGSVALQRSRRRDGAGWVALVGGGPGTDALLTIRGRHLLSTADVVVVDRLAPRGLLADLPASVRIVDVGKVPGRHAVTQDEINAVLVEEALAGHGVVRLKGGTVRGEEEKPSVEVVPGVTSAISVPAAAGIPVTHRGVARGFTVVTGHEEIPSLPSGRDHTLVLLMGVAGLQRTTDLLIAGGRDPRCPVAIVERG